MIRELKIYNHQNCYDGFEKGFYELEIDFELLGKFKVTNLISFDQLLGRIGNNSFQLISKRLNAIKDPFFNNYTTGFNCQLSFIIICKIIIVISYGETQPGRYQIFKEGIWEITE